MRIRLEKQKKCWLNLNNNLQVSSVNLANLKSNCSKSTWDFRRWNLNLIWKRWKERKTMNDIETKVREEENLWHTLMTTRMTTSWETCEMMSVIQHSLIFSHLTAWRTTWVWLTSSTSWYIRELLTTMCSTFLITYGRMSSPHVQSIQAHGLSLNSYITVSSSCVSS